MKNAERRLLAERLARIEDDLQRAQKHLSLAASLLHATLEDLAGLRGDVATVSDQVEHLASKEDQ